MDGFALGKLGAVSVDLNHSSTKSLRTKRMQVRSVVKKNGLVVVGRELVVVVCSRL